MGTKIKGKTMWPNHFCATIRSILDCQRYLYKGAGVKDGIPYMLRETVPGTEGRSQAVSASSLRRTDLLMLDSGGVRPKVTCRNMTEKGEEG